MKPLVSVIVPLYNAEAWIRETLESILESTYPSVEVIVVDDGSRDKGAEIAEHMAGLYTQIRVLRQENQGVAAARNHAIREAKGKYILPVDSDDKIGRTYIEHAVREMEANDRIRVCSARAWLIGDGSGEWKLDSFSYAKLARKNMIHASSMYRREDWEKVGGYCEEDIYREDWDFWISLFELGGEYKKLDEIGLYYRIHKGSRRHSAKSHKREIVNAINRRHPAYLKRYLRGPLHYHRSWSRLLNILSKVTQVGEWDNWDEGEVIYQGRNLVRLYQDVVIKEFGRPSLVGSLVSLVHQSKARRSYRNAQRLEGLTPAPIGYREERIMGLLWRSHYASKKSPCTHCFNDLIGNHDFPHREELLREIGKLIARLHERGAIHKDLSGGNILIDPETLQAEVVDINRMRWYSHTPIEATVRWKNMERLNIDRAALATIAEAYCKETGDNVQEATDYIISHRWKKHVKRNITNLDT